MKKLKLLGLFFLLLKANAGFSQYQLGFYNSNFGGVSSIRTNPANAADNRMKFQLNLLNTGFNLSNNYLVTETPYSYSSLLFATIKNPGILNNDSFNGAPIWQDSYLKEVLNGKDKSVNLSHDLMGPSIFFGIGKNFGLSYTNRVKTTIQLNGMNESLVRLARNSLKVSGLNNVFHADAKFGLMVNSYAENALTLGGVLLNKEKHFLKGGFSLKSLSGIYNMYVQNKGININFYDSDSLVLTQDEISYGYVKEQYYGFPSTSPNNNIIPPLTNALRKNLGGGTGFDFGLVYEYRPKWSDYYQSFDNKMRWKRDQNKYLYKIGVSLNDLGSIHYNNSEWVKQYKLRLLSNSDTVQWGQLDTLGLTTSTSFSNAVGRVIKHADSSTSYSVGLPTTFNINFDWRINRFLFLSGNWVQSLRQTNAIAVRTPSMLALSPRVEFRNFELALPMMSAFDYTKFQIGAFARFGPVFIGSDNIGGFFGKTSFNGIDLYAGASIPIYYHPWKDRDQDGVSNKKDRCDGEKGLWETKGCPDKDGDKIVDKDDLCPDIAGLKELKGCPDTDKDGIADKDDECPNDFGLKEFKGCPDTDKDGIADKDDKCPTLAGALFLNGCPDADNDSIADSEDKCPTVAGLKSLNGCPDTDKDGIADNDDQCPTEAGTTKTKGCPDTDKDGIADKDDKCPTIPGLMAFQGCKDSDLDGIADPDDKCPNEYGTKENNGCPLVVKKDVVSANLETEEQEILKKAFENLTFESGKAIISAQSKVGLDSLAFILIEKPTYYLQVSGHTDNEGSAAKNEALSLNRANEVKVYLVAKGVNANRIVAKGFGSSVPVAPNNNPENKRKNRRVELKVYKP